MKSNDTPRLGRRRTVMKMEPAHAEPSCGTAEASAAVPGIQHRPGKAGYLGKINQSVLKSLEKAGRGSVKQH